MTETEGCECVVLCEMGPTCPGGMLARLPGSGCWRRVEHDSGPDGLTTHFPLIDGTCACRATKPTATQPRADERTGGGS